MSAICVFRLRGVDSLVVGTDEGEGEGNNDGDGDGDGGGGVD